MVGTWVVVALTFGQVDAGAAPSPAPRVREDGLLDPGEIANPPLEPAGQGEVAPLAQSPRGRRVLFSALFGALAGAGGALVGGLFGDAVAPGAQRVQDGRWLGAAVGWSLGVPFGVLASGAAFGGSGGVLPLFLGELLGAGLGVGALALANGLEALPILAVATLVGAIVGFEVSSAPERSPE